MQLEIGGDPVVAVTAKITDPLTENERSIALSAWGKDHDSKAWGNLVLGAYDGQAARVAELEAVVSRVLMGSLMAVRRAAFSPEIGVRYTEAIRAEIADECRRLEDLCRDALESRREPMVVAGDGVRGSEPADEVRAGSD